MGSIPATEFKAKCLELMDRVAARGETFLITKRGRPVAKLAPVDALPKTSLLGCFQDKVHIAGDVVGPVLPSEAWKTLDEWEEVNEASGPKGRAVRTRARRPRRRRS